MKLAKYVKKVQLALEAEQHEALKADLECGDLSDTQLAIADQAERSADHARQLVELIGDARETDSDAVELADMESRFSTAMEGIKVVNAAGGFTMESLQWAQRAVDAILAPIGVNVELKGTSMEAIGLGQKTTLSMESIEEVIEVIGATRQDVENLSVDGILRILDVLEEALPDVKDRLVALHQSIRTLSYDEEIEIKLDSLIFKSLAVNGQLPVGLREYFTGYQNFANKILSTYSENALEAASKAGFVADALCKLGPNSCPVEAISKAMADIGDPRKVIDADQLMFVLPGSGPLFGNKVVGEDDEEIDTETDDETLDALDGAAVGDDPSAVQAPVIPDGAAADDSAVAGAGEVPATQQVAADEPTAELTVPEVAPAADTVATATGTPPVAGAPAPAEPAKEPAPIEPTADLIEKPAEEAPVAAPAAGDEGTAAPATPAETAPGVAPGEEEEELDEDGKPKPKVAKEAYGEQAPEATMTPCQALVTKLEKFTTNFAPLDPLSWDDRPDSDTPSIRVLSKDTIDGVVGELIKALEIVNIKSFGESHRQTWAQSRSAFGAYRQSFDSLTPQQVADLAPATPAVGEYLNTVFTLSAWPALHLLANLVFTANAFLLLAERSISGQSAEEEPAFNADEDGVPGDDEGTDEVLDDGAAASAGQAANDAEAGARAGEVGALNDETDASSTT